MAKVNPIPAGFHTITPSLTVRGAADAISFYKKAFGAEEISRMPAPDGKSIWHANLKFGSSMLFLADESAAMGNKSPQAIGGTPVNLQLNVDNVDKAFATAVAAGATVKMEVADMFWGDRIGVLVDPFGFSWTVSTRMKELTREEMTKAGAEFAKKMAMKPGM